MKTTKRRFIKSSAALAVLLGCGLAFAPTETSGQRAGGATPTGFSGQATAVRATVLGNTVLLGDTGALPLSGGNLRASELDVTVPGVLAGQVLHGTTIGQGDRSRAEASVADATITVGGQTITAGFLQSRATAVCRSGISTSEGSSELVNLNINGQVVAVTTAPNQRFELPGVGFIIFNEQIREGGTGNYSAITVNALHVVINNQTTGEVADVVIASAHADIRCENVACKGADFITGGGFIFTIPNGSRGTFGVAGGIKKNGQWGHLTYIDHGTGMKVKATSVTSYTVGATANSRVIAGAAEINGVAGTYRVEVADNAEPGRNADTFNIVLSNGYTQSSTLSGGNIQLHKPCR